MSRWGNSSSISYHNGDAKLELFGLAVGVAAPSLDVRRTLRTPLCGDYAYRITIWDRPCAFKIGFTTRLVKERVAELVNRRSKRTPQSPFVIQAWGGPKLLGQVT